MLTLEQQHKASLPHLPILPCLMRSKQMLAVQSLPRLPPGHAPRLPAAAADGIPPPAGWESVDDVVDALTFAHCFICSVNGGHQLQN